MLHSYVCAAVHRTKDDTRALVAIERARFLRRIKDIVGSRDTLTVCVACSNSPHTHNLLLFGPNQAALVTDPYEKLLYLQLLDLELAVLEETPVCVMRPSSIHCFSFDSFILDPGRRGMGECVEGV
jgi:hypothetical protein